MELPEMGREGAWSGLIWLRIETAGGMHFNCSTTTVSAVQQKGNSVAHKSDIIQPNLKFSKSISKFYTYNWAIKLGCQIGLSNFTLQ
jgi:hypothetical protein